MKKIRYIILPLLAVTLLNGCSKCTQNNLNESVVPIVFPYSDYQQVAFLKNRQDTIVFKGQGIQNSFYDECYGSDGFRSQKKSIVMKYSNGEFFGIDIIAGNDNSSDGIDITLNNNYFFNSDFYSTFQHGNFASYLVNGIKYDTVAFYPITLQQEQRIIYDTIYFKPRLGFIKITMDGNLYEIIQ